jgi:hypothetical protein
VSEFDLYLIWHHIARYPTADPNYLKCLMEVAPKQYRLTRNILLNRCEQPSETVNCVTSHPCTRSMGTLSAQNHREPHGPLAARLDLAIGWFPEQRNITLQKVGAQLKQLPQTTVLRGHFFSGVEHIGDIYCWLLVLPSKLQHDSEAALHIC